MSHFWVDVLLVAFMAAGGVLVLWAVSQGRYIRFQRLPVPMAVGVFLIVVCAYRMLARHV